MSSKKSKKPKENLEMFRPGTESREIFSLALSIISELLSDKKIEIEIDSKGELELAFCSPEINSSFLEKAKDKISFDQFMAIISTEIESLLNASVYSDKVKGIDSQIPKSIINELGMDEFIWRLTETCKVLTIPESFKQEVLFKKTSKSLLFKKLKWEIASKFFDADLGEIDKFKYATISIQYSQPIAEASNVRFSGQGFSLQLPTTTEPKNITMDMQKKDIKKLIDSLQEIIDNF